MKYYFYLGRCKGIGVITLTRILICRSHDGFKEEANGLLVPTNDKYADQKRVFNDLGMGVLDNAWNGKFNSRNKFILFPFSLKQKLRSKFIPVFFIQEVGLSLPVLFKHFEYFDGRAVVQLITCSCRQSLNINPF